MKKTIYTNIHLDYGGYYLEEHEWISPNSIYAILFKTSSLEEITYSVLVEKILKKIAIKETCGKVKLSYNLSKTRRESYIFDDDDVIVFLTSLDNEGLKAVLHVELFNDIEMDVRLELHSRVERGSSFGVNYGEVLSNDLVNDVENAGIGNICREGKTGEQHDERIYEENVSCNEIVVRMMDNHVDESVELPMDNHLDECVELPMDNHVDEDVQLPMDNHVVEYVELAMDQHVDEDDEVPMDNHVDAYVELPRPVEESQSQYVKEWEDGTGLELDQEFCSKESVRDLVSRAANKNCFGFQTIKSDTERLMLRCRQASEGCKWYILAAKIKKSVFFSVRVHRKMHTCSRSVESTRKHKQKGLPRLVASVLHEDFPGNFDTPTPKMIKTIVKGRLGFECSYCSALRGKKQHVSDVRGGPEKSYMILYSYLYTLEEANSGTVTSVELDAEKRFKYLFIALGASIEGFRAMRKVIVVDATFLKTIYGGMLVFATAQDPNHHHYPIVFGVIDGEKDVSWTWFFKKMKSVIPDVPGLVFISDRNASIIKSVSEVYPSAKHAHCIWHLSQNLRGKVKNDKDEAAAKFRECAHIYTTSEFNIEYVDFRRRFPKGGEYLNRSIGLEKWARCHFEGDKYNLDTSNSAESMNFVFKKARSYSLLPMIDAIIEKFAEWFNKHRRDSGEAPGTSKVVPIVENILHTTCAEASLLAVTELNSYHLEYNVIGKDGKTYLVDLKMKSCSCRRFDIDKYPCIHAIAAARYVTKKGGTTAKISIYDLCSKYYLIETWALAYSRTIYLVPHESKWSVPTEIEEKFALPPDYIKTAGRNQETRFPSTGEPPRKRTKNKHMPGINLERWLQSARPEEGN